MTYEQGKKVCKERLEEENLIFRGYTGVDMVEHDKLLWRYGWMDCFKYMVEKGLIKGDE